MFSSPTKERELKTNKETSNAIQYFKGATVGYAMHCCVTALGEICHLQITFHLLDISCMEYGNRDL